MRRGRRKYKMEENKGMKIKKKDGRQNNDWRKVKTKWRRKVKSQKGKERNVEKEKK